MMPPNAGLDALHVATAALAGVQNLRTQTPASISSGMIAPVKIQVTGIRPLDKLSLIAE